MAGAGSVSEIIIVYQCMHYQIVIFSCVPVTDESDGLFANSIQNQIPD